MHTLTQHDTTHERARAPLLTIPHVYSSKLLNDWMRIWTRDVWIDYWRCVWHVAPSIRTAPVSYISHCRYRALSTARFSSINGKFNDPKNSSFPIFGRNAYRFARVAISYQSSERFFGCADKSRSHIHISGNKPYTRLLEHIKEIWAIYSQRIRWA